MECLGFWVSRVCKDVRRGVAEAVIQRREGPLRYVKSGKQGCGEKGIHGILSLRAFLQNEERTVWL